ncbi:protein NUCLEAR FUSION DEFECTIVE 4-like [Coffea eugenioides]|uniref:protein NUCLEAR FUSION DEFECTIVE 4-like n=1 Tax=Coffea eugenioides TaxID=49369 RepID=UPI000F60B0E1|nr:protein NUCLEAR FUSION DEFECTIVE 4-like [Coffea eugenioides]
MENSHRHQHRGSGSKWIAAVASIWIQCSCGASYAFGIYSPILKSSQGYDQATLDTVSVFKDIGANVGIISGFLYSAVVPDRRGRGQGRSWLRQPWVVILAGVIQCFLGYIMMWASVTGIIDRPGVGLMCLFMFLAAHAQTFFNTANVVTAVHNFQDYSGTIVGIMKGFLGLSGAVVIQVYDTLFEGNPSTFLLILALLPALISILLMWLVKIDAARTKDEKKYLNGFSVVSLVVAAYLMILIILENAITLPLWSRIITFLVLLSLLSSPLGVACKAQSDSSLNLAYYTSSVGTTPLMDEAEPIKQETTSSRAANPVDIHPDDDEVQSKSGSEDMLDLGAELNLFQAMRTVNFWLLFVAMICGMGSGLATINNISQIGQSLGYSTVERSTLVSLWSIWNFLGRFGAGYASDIFLHRRGWARPLLMALTLAAMTAGHVVIASGFSGNLFIGSVLVGVCYGSQWSLMPTITSEIFGVRHLGTIFNTIAVASPIGSYVLSVRVIGYIYDRHAAGEENTCYGKYCFMSSFFILASVTVLGFLVALALFFRTRRFYSQLVVRWLRHTATR